MVKNTYGTGCFMLMHTGAKAMRSKNNLLTTVAWQVGGKPSTRWREHLHRGCRGAMAAGRPRIIKHSADVEKLAARVPDNGGVFLVPAFAGLGAPHWTNTRAGRFPG